MLAVTQIRYILAFMCVLLILTTMSTLCAEEIRENKILSHDLEIELFLKEHKLKAIDHLLVPYENSE